MTKKKGKKNPSYQEPHWNVYKKFLYEYGWEAALLIQHFRDLQVNFFPNGFFQQYNRIGKSLKLSSKKIEKALKLLHKEGFLEIKKCESNKNFYKVDLVAYSNFLTFDPYDDLLVDDEMLAMQGEGQYLQNGGTRTSKTAAHTRVTKLKTSHVSTETQVSSNVTLKNEFSAYDKN